MDRSFRSPARRLYLYSHKTRHTNANTVLIPKLRPIVVSPVVLNTICYIQIDTLEIERLAYIHLHASHFIEARLLDKGFTRQ